MTSAHQPQELIDWGWRRGAAHVKAANQAFYAALSARDIGAMQKVWSSDIDIENIGPFSKAAHVGWDAIKKRFEETFGNVLVNHIQAIDLGAPITILAGVRSASDAPLSRPTPH